MLLYCAQFVESDSLMCSPNEGKGPKSSIWSVLELCGEAFTVVLNLPSPGAGQLRLRGDRGLQCLT